MHHQRYQIEDEIGVLPEVAEGGAAEVPEPKVVRGSRSSHGVDHFARELDGRRERFRISA